MIIKDIIDRYKKIGLFQLSSGKPAYVYYDLKEAMGEPDNLQAFILELSQKIKIKPNVIIGIDYGGIPLAVGLSLHMKIPFAILRKEQKRHGMQRRIEGYQEKGDVLLLDDVSTTGESIREAFSYLENHGYRVMQVETILNRDVLTNSDNK
jgi:orotate phosphoribosyltransferase